MQENKRTKTERIKQFLRQELSGWKPWEIVWLLASCGILAGISLVGGDSVLGILSATTGVANVVCTGKGKLSAFAFGIVNSILYAVISFEAHLYGETMLNALYYLPMQFVGFAMWSRHMNAATKEVQKKRMRGSERLVLLAGIVVGTVVYGWCLLLLGDTMPYIDAFTTVASVIALIVSVKMYAEQWWIWFFVDGVSVFMWWKDYTAGSDNLATLLMWIVFWMNAVLMLIRWEREARREQDEEITKK